MDCSAVIATHLKWLANMANIYPTSFDTVFNWLLFFVMMPFLLPLIVVLLYCTYSLLTYVYEFCYGLEYTSTGDKAWDKLKYLATMGFHCYARFYHGYEVEGLDNIPAEGAALMVMYHGAIPLDMCFIISHAYLYRNRHVKPVLDRIFFKIPGFGLGLKVLEALPGTIAACSSVLEDGHLLIIAPGGAYEGMFCRNNYELLWRNRVGYAKVAIEAKSPIIPVFTVNISDVYRTISIARSWFEKLYLKFRLPVLPIYGGCPVKLRTIIGHPIPFDPELTAEELNKKVMMSMQQLIKDHQRVPGSIAMALLDRVYCPKKEKVV